MARVAATPLRLVQEGGWNYIAIRGNERKVFEWLSCKIRPLGH